MKNDLDAIRKQVSSALHSALDEYAPKTEIFSLIDEIRSLREALSYAVNIAQERVALSEGAGPGKATHAERHLAEHGPSVLEGKAWVPE